MCVLFCALCGFIGFGAVWWWREFKRQDRYDKLADKAEADAGAGAVAGAGAGKAGGSATPAPGNGAAPAASAGGQSISRRGDSGMTR